MLDEAKLGAELIARDVRFKLNREDVRDILCARTMSRDDGGLYKVFAKWRAKGGTKPKQLAAMVKKEAEAGNLNYILCLSIGYPSATGVNLSATLEFLLHTHDPLKGPLNLTFLRSDDLQAIPWLASHPRSAMIETRVREALAGSGLSELDLDQRVFDALMEELYPELREKAVRSGKLWSKENLDIIDFLSDIGVTVSMMTWAGLESGPGLYETVTKYERLYSTAELREDVLSDLTSVRENQAKYGLFETVSPGVGLLVSQAYLVRESAALELLASRLHPSRVPTYCVYQGDWRKAISKVESLYSGITFRDMPLLSMELRKTRSPSVHQARSYERVTELFSSVLLNHSATMPSVLAKKEALHRCPGADPRPSGGGEGGGGGDSVPAPAEVDSRSSGTGSFDSTAAEDEAPEASLAEAGAAGARPGAASACEVHGLHARRRGERPVGGESVDSSPSSGLMPS